MKLINSIKNSVINGNSILKTELDTDELKGLSYIAVHPHVKKAINYPVMKLTHEATAMKNNGGRINILQPKWSEIVARV